MAFADGPDTHDEPHIHSALGLLRMDHHARIAEGGTLNGVFACEGCTEQQAAGRGQFPVGIEAIGELVCVAEERLNQAMVSPLESRDTSSRLR